MGLCVLLRRVWCIPGAWWQRISSLQAAHKIRLRGSKMCRQRMCCMTYHSKCTRRL